MVIGLSYIEWRVLVEKPNGPKIEMQIISGVEEAVVRGLSQSDGMSESAVELKMSWNSWALKLCEGMLKGAYGLYRSEAAPVTCPTVSERQFTCGPLLFRAQLRMAPLSSGPGASCSAQFSCLGRTPSRKPSIQRMKC